MQIRAELSWPDQGHVYQKAFQLQWEQGLNLKDAG